MLNIPCLIERPLQQKILIISAVHDYRMKRRGSIQAIADALRDGGADVTFLSIRYSFLSRFKKDPRQEFVVSANTVQRHQGIDCFLWWTPFHPFGTRYRWLNAALTPLFWIYARWPSRAVDQLIRESNRIIVESGLGIVLVRRISKLNPSATVIYRASDRLSTIAQHPVVGRTLIRDQKLFAHFALLGPRMATDFIWAYPKAFLVPPGLDSSYVESGLQSPYSGELNAVSLGPMLFDASFFDAAGPLFPQVSFHIFGVVDPPKGSPENVFYHPEVRYQETAGYIRHAIFGVAPYLTGQDISYLADTSSKLLQYASFGLPAVCPFAVIGQHLNRFGYQPGDASSIKAAISSALAAPRQKGTPYKTWRDIVARLLAPTEFEDTALRPTSPQAAGEGVADTPLLSLVVATRGRREPLRRLLASLQAQTSKAFEVIIVDQNRAGYLDDDIALFSDEMVIRRLTSEPGLSLARNCGLAVSEGSIVAFPDDDCWYPTTLVDDVLRFFSLYSEFDLLLGRTIDESGSPSLNPARKSGGEVTRGNVWYSGNSNTLFVRGTIARNLRFNERLGVGAQSPYQSGEETDFVLQFLNRGCKAVYCPNITVLHCQVDPEIGSKQLSRAWRYSARFGRVPRIMAAWLMRATG